MAACSLSGVPYRISEGASPRRARSDGRLRRLAPPTLRPLVTARQRCERTRDLLRTGHNPSTAGEHPGYRRATPRRRPPASLPTDPCREYRTAFPLGYRSAQAPPSLPRAGPGCGRRCSGTGGFNPAASCYPRAGMVPSVDRSAAAVGAHLDVQEVINEIVEAGGNRSQRNTTDRKGGAFNDNNGCGSRGSARCTDDPDTQ